MSYGGSDGPPKNYEKGYGNVKRIAAVRESVFARRLSPYQYAVLRSAASGSGLAAGAVNMTTFGPLVRRGLVSIDNHQRVTVLSAGADALETYRNMPPPLRSKPGELTEHVSIMLGIISRRKRTA
jgi:hypothetical protein